MKPLEGVRVLEIASIGPGPLAANTFLELGAEVIRVNNPNAVNLLPPSVDPSLENRINITVDLKSEDGISPGQACVFYNKDQFGHKVLGGGWIKE